MHSFLWFLSVLWTVVYGVRSCLSSSSSRDILPATAPRRSNPKLRFSVNDAVEISLRNFHLEFRTSALNNLHDSWIAFWEEHDREGESKKLARKAIRVFYNVGVVCGVFGLVLGIAVLAYSSGRFLLALITPSRDVGGRRLVKKDFEVSGGTGESGFGVNAIIPGVTVPWSHLPFILLALFFSQCIHEAGHAMAGAIEALPLHTVGASLTLILPSAFVSFSSSMDGLLTPARLRVISSGAWHNLVLWTVIYLASFANMSSIWTSLGWKDIRPMGLVVVEVEEGSPLVHHIQPGDLLVRLDDTPLNSSKAAVDDVWSRYLLGSYTHEEKGWCVDAEDLYNQPTSCCQVNSKVQLVHPPAAQLSCFVPVENVNHGHCIDPVPILVTSGSGQRCYSMSDCNEHAPADGSEEHPKECIRPDGNEQLLRIEVSPPIWEYGDAGRLGNESFRTVLWSGPKEEVWEQVKVGMLAPSHRLLPAWLPSATATFFSYLSTLSLSLYIFNLFALPFLDGSHFLSALLDYIGDSREQDTFDNDTEEELDIELGAGRASYRRSRANSAGLLVRWAHSSAKTLRYWTWGWRRRIRRRKTNVERAVKYGTIALMCTTVVGMIWPS